MTDAEVFDELDLNEQRVLLDALPSAALLVDDGRILMANQGSMSLFGGDVTGMMVEQLVPEGRRGGHVQKREGFVESGELQRQLQASDPLQARRLDGGLVPCRIGLSKLPNGVVLVEITDVTQQYVEAERAAKAEELLHAAEREAQLAQQELKSRRRLQSTRDQLLTVGAIVTLIALVAFVSLWRTSDEVSITVLSMLKDVSLVAVGGVVTTLTNTSGKDEE